MKMGKIYFLRRADGRIKIGFTTNLKSRLVSLTRSHGPLEILRVINGDTRREKHMHAHFAAAHDFGEWFRGEDWVLPAIMEVDDGDIVSLAASEIERRWREGEKELAETAKAKAERLLQIRKQRTGATNVDCLRGIQDDYNIRPHFMTHLMADRASSVGAYAMKALSDALISEMLAYRDDLLADIAAVERGDPIPEREERKRYQQLEAAKAHSKRKVR